LRIKENNGKRLKTTDLVTVVTESVDMFFILFSVLTQFHQGQAFFLQVNMKVGG